MARLTPQNRETREKLHDYCITCPDDLIEETINKIKASLKGRDLAKIDIIISSEYHLTRNQNPPS